MIGKGCGSLSSAGTSGGGARVCDGVEARSLPRLERKPLLCSTSSCSFSIGRFCLEEEKVGWRVDGGWFRQQPFNIGEQLVQ